MCRLTYGLSCHCIHLVVLVILVLTHDFCHGCQFGRHICIACLLLDPCLAQLAFFNLIHCDLWTSPVVSISSFKYYLVILSCQIFSLMCPPCSVAPSSLSSATTGVSSIMLPPEHSFYDMACSYGCLVPTLFLTMVKSSALFIPLTMYWVEVLHTTTYLLS
jgi:hypothetical protein